MFPTLAKMKIPRHLTYPVNAKWVSEAFTDVPQAGFLEIYFYWGRYEQAQRKSGQPYSVFQVDYYFRKSDQFTPRDVEEDRPRWIIRILAVPREIALQVRPLLQSEAVPAMRAWLLERPNLMGQEGSQRIAFLFDESRETLQVQTHFHA